MASSFKPYLLLTHGLPGCGKSTWAEAQEDVRSGKTVRIERDDIRTTLFGEKYHQGNPVKKKESQVSAVQQQLLEQAFAAGKNVILSDTNLSPFVVEQHVQTAKRHGATLRHQYFDVPVEECKRRNELRGRAGGRFVPEHVVDAMAAKAYDSEGHLKEVVVSSKGKVFFVARETRGMRRLAAYNRELEKLHPLTGKPFVVVDCDGTLFANQADANRAFGRPGEKKDFATFNRSIEHAPVNHHVVNLANRMRQEEGIAIVVLTGRSDESARELITALRRTGLAASHVIMKREGDFRKSDDFKPEAVRKLMEERGLVLVHAIDDRPEDVAMWTQVLKVGVSQVPYHQPVDPETAPARYPIPEVMTTYGSGYCLRCGQPLKQGNLGPTCATKF